jgi:hypothetical protein
MAVRGRERQTDDGLLVDLPVVDALAELQRLALKAYASAIVFPNSATRGRKLPGSRLHWTPWRP